MPVEGLEQACGTCGRIAGDHTLREWAACIGKPTTDLPYEDTPADMADAVNAAMRDRFGLEEDIVVADHIVLRALALGASVGGGGEARIPALLHEFQVGIPGQPPTTVAKVLYIGDIDSIRAYGRLARDSANGAANAAGR